MEPSDQILFGREPGLDLVFSGDPDLSRRAGELRHIGTGVAVTNLSGVHSLYVKSLAGKIKLSPLREGSPPGLYVMTAGEFEISVRNWERSGCRILVHITATSVNVAAEMPAGAQGTRLPLRLNPHTKEFATALVLCKSKLEAGGSSTPIMPTVPEITRRVLEATGSWNLLREYESDNGGRTRLSGRIHEHLKQLRAKLYDRGLVPAGPLAPPILADVLINNDIIKPSDLRLFDDPGWLEVQSRLWWDEKI
jgi:hypothetical protein